MCIINYLGKKIYECNSSQLFQSGISEANKYIKTKLFMASSRKAVSRTSGGIKTGAGPLLLLPRLHVYLYVHAFAKEKKITASTREVLRFIVEKSTHSHQTLYSLSPALTRASEVTYRSVTSIHTDVCLRGICQTSLCVNMCSCLCVFSGTHYHSLIYFGG